MNQPAEYMFSLKDAAMAHAVAAKRILGDDPEILNQHRALVPVFVSGLFQSLEAALKYAGATSGLFQPHEPRGRAFRSGHGINEIAGLMRERLRDATTQIIANALTVHANRRNAATIVFEMIDGPRMQQTREAYWQRNLVYGEVRAGDFAYITPLPEWVDAVTAVAEHLDSTAEIFAQWAASEAESPNFAIWFGALRYDRMMGRAR